MYVSETDKKRDISKQLRRLICIDNIDKNIVEHLKEALEINEKSMSIVLLSSEEREKYMQKSFLYLNFSNARTKNYLKSLGVVYIKDIYEYKLSQLKKTPNFGIKVQRELFDKLHEKGLPDLV